MKYARTSRILASRMTYHSLPRSFGRFHAEHLPGGRSGVAERTHYTGAASSDWPNVEASDRFPARIRATCWTPLGRVATISQRPAEISIR